jgi:hypothetical protein
MPSRQAETPESILRSLFGKRLAKAGPEAEERRSRRNDILIAGAGVALGLTCALFPWYIFLNQEQFGPPAVKFEGTDAEVLVDDATATPVLPRGNSEVRIIGIPSLDLDYTPTGSLPRVFTPGVEPAEQAYPDDASAFKVLHVTAGRAMIEDDTGIWVVEPGSRLPDRSRVESIERRKGKWVLVTSEKKVLAAGG